MVQTAIEALLTNAPWAAVLIACVAAAAIVVMFVCALILVPRNRRVEAIMAMAVFVRAIRSPKRDRPR